MSLDEKNLYPIGGQGGSGGGSTPSEDPDTLQSHTFVSVIDLLGEGQIGGLVGTNTVEKEKSIYIDGTPMRTNGGTENFKGVSWTERTGTQDQSYIDGYGGIETPTSINVQLKFNVPKVISITNSRVDEVRIILAIGGLMVTESDGDIRGSSVSFSIGMATNSGASSEVAARAIKGKASSRYQVAYTVKLPKVANDGTPITRWDIQVTRTTSDSTEAGTQDDLYFDSYSEVITKKLTYPNSALVATRVNSEHFSSMPKREYLVDGLLIKVPSNYNHVTREYTGIWDGSFKLASSNNPAWIMFDILTNNRYGLGEYIDAGLVDEARLYQIGRYCDQMVDDGFGNLEPRYTINCTINSRAEAYDLIADICSAFNGMSYWAGGQVGFTIDAPSDPVMAFTSANIEGEFGYSGTSVKDRHSIAVVTYNDPKDDYKQAVEYVEDPDLIERYGVRKIEIQAFGCTSRAQAHRYGRWILYTEHQQSEVCSFTAGMDASTLMPGSIVQIQDEHRAGKRFGGRLLSCTATSAILDDDIDFTGFETGLKFAVMLSDGSFVEREIATKVTRTTVIGTTGNTRTATEVTWVTPLEKLPVSQAVWVISAPNLELVQARVVGVKQGVDLDKFEISVIPHNPNKYAAIEKNVMLEIPPTSILSSRNQVPPSEVRIKQEVLVHQGLSKTRLVIDWERADKAIRYSVEWKREEDNWVRLPETANLSAEVEDVYTGTYIARVTAIGMSGARSYPQYSVSADLTGKSGNLALPVAFEAHGILFGMEMSWEYPANSKDSSHVVIEVSDTNNVADAKLLAAVPYPATTHTVTGLMGNLTQYYRIKLVDKSGNESEFTPFVSAKTLEDPEILIEMLSGHVDKIVLSPEVVDQIEQATVNNAQNRADLLAETAARIAELQATQNDLVTEVDARIAADATEADARIAGDATEAAARATAIAKEATDRAAALTAESTARVNAIKAEETARNAAINAKVAEINTNIATQIDAVQDGIDQEVIDRTDAVNTVRGELNTYKTSNDSAVATALQKVEAVTTAHDATVTELDALQSSFEDLTGDLSAATSDLSSFKQTVANADAALGTRIDNLTTTVNTNNTSVNGRITNVETSITTLESNVNTKTSQLQSSLDTTNTNVTAATNAANAANTLAGGKGKVLVQSTAPAVADQLAQNLWIDTTGNANTPKRWTGSAWVAVTDKVATDAATAAAAAQATANTKADAAALTSLTTRVTTAEGNITSQGTRVTNLENSVNHATTGLASKASSSALTAVDNKVTAANGRIDTTNSDVTTLTGRVSTVEGAVATKAEAAALTALTTRVTNAEGVNTSQGSAITTLENDLATTNSTVATKASTTALNTLDSKVTSVDGKATTNASAITALQGKMTTVENGLTTKADSSALVNYSTKTATDAAIAAATTALKASLGLYALPTDKDTSQQNKWARITLRKTQPYITNSVVPDYSYIGTYPEHSEGYFAEGATTTLPIDNSINYYRTLINVAAASTINLGNLMGDDAHAIYVDGKEVYRKTGFSTNACSFEVTAGDHVVDIVVNNGTGGAGFSSTITMSSQVTSMYAPKLTGVLIGNKAEASAVTALDTRVTSAEGVNTTQSTSITALENSVNHATTGLATKASSAALTTVDNRVTAVDGRVTTTNSNVATLSGRVSTVEGAVATKADVSALNNIYTKTEADAKATSLAAGEISKYDASLVIGGTNLFSFAGAVAGYTDPGNGGVVTTSAAHQSMNTLIPLGSHKSMTYQVWNPAAIRNTTNINRIAFFRADGSFLSTTNLPGLNGTTYQTTLIQIPDAATHARLGVLAGPANGGRDVNVKVKIEFGNKATDWSEADSAILDSLNVNANAISTTNTEVSRINGVVVAQGTSITNLQAGLATANNNIATKADGSALTALTTRVTNAEGVNTSQGSAITTLQNTVNHATTGLATKASSAALTTLDNKVTAVDGRVTTNASNITTLQGEMTAVENGLATKADGSALSALTTRVSNAEGELSSQSSKVTKLEAGVGNTISHIIATFRNGNYRSGGIAGGVYSPKLVKAGGFYRGMNLVVWAADGTLGSISTFDTYATPTAIADLVTAVLALPTNTYFTLVGVDNVGSSSAFQSNADLKNFVVANGGSSDYYSTWGDTSLPIFTSMVGTGSATGIQHSFNSNVSNDWVKYPITFIGGIPEGMSGTQPIDESKFATASALSTLDSKVTSIDGRVTSNAGSITNLQAGLTAANNSISTKADSSALSALTARVDGTESGIQASNENITSLQSKLDNVSVGGTNLLSNTKDVGNIGTYLGFGYKRSTRPAGSTQYVDPLGYFVNNLSAGTYVLSFYARANKVQSVNNFFYAPDNTQSAESSTGDKSNSINGNVSLSLTTEWKRYWVRWVIPSDTAVKGLVVARLDTMASTEQWVEVAAPKLEKGTLATDWSPSSSDVQSQLDTNASATDTLNTTVSNLNGTVTSQGTRLTNLENSVNSTTNGLATKASASALDTLSNKVNHSTTGLDAIANKATALETKVNAIKVGGSNLFALKELCRYNAGTLYTTTGTYFTVAGTQITGAGMAATDRIGNAIPYTEGQDLTIAFTAVSNITDANIYYRCLNASGAQTKAQTTAVATITGTRYTLTLPASSFPTGTATVNLGFGGTATNPVVKDVVVQLGNMATAWTESYRDSPDMTLYAGAQALTDLTTRVSTAEGKITSQATSITNLSTTVGDQTTSISTLTTSVNGINASHTVKINNNGYSAGFGLISTGVNGVTTSAFKVDADFFEVGKSGAGIKPFIIVTSANQIIEGVTYPSAGTYINSAKIANATIKLAHIDTASIGSLSAISANLGTIQVGAANIEDGAITTAKIDNLAVTTAKIGEAQITTSKIGDLQVDTLKIKDQAVNVAVAANGVSQLSLETSGGRVAVNIGININYQLSFSNGSNAGDSFGIDWIALRVLRNGTVIKEYRFSPTAIYDYSVTWRYVNSLPLLVDQPTAGLQTYSIQVSRNSSMSWQTPVEGSAIKLSGISLSLTETKK